MTGRFSSDFPPAENYIHPNNAMREEREAITGKDIAGWNFWKVVSSDGKEKGTLYDLRMQLAPQVKEEKVK